MSIRDSGLAGVPLARLMAALLLTFSACGVAQAAVCRVTTAGNANNDGSDWPVPMDLPSALGDANCTEVWLAAGTYSPGANRADSFVIQPGVAVYGGFAGSETQRDQRDPVTQLVELSGDIGVPGDTSDNSFHVVWMDGTGATPVTSATVLDGLAITGGNANGLGLERNGGGLFCDGHGAGSSCGPTLRNIGFVDNSANSHGGAIYNDGHGGGESSPILEQVTFSGNSAEMGGALFNDGRSGGIASPELRNVSFAGNSATDNGGAIYNDGSDGGVSSPALAYASFSGNSANYGGALFNNAQSGTSSPILSHVILWNDSATTAGNEIHNLTGAAPSISYSIIEGSGGSGTNWDATLGSDGGGNLDQDPLLGALTDNGGATATMLPATGSPAIDAGQALGCPASDQRGVARPQGIACDIGAVEVAQSSQQLAVTVTGAGQVNADNPPVPDSGSIAACSASGGSCSAEYPTGTSVPLHAVPDLGNHLVQWAGDCTGVQLDITVVLDGSKSCMAEFAVNHHALGGTVSGLAVGNSVTVQNNGGDDLVVSANGAFQFASQPGYGSSYAVTVLAQPETPAQVCTVSNGSGTMADADVTDIQIACVTITHTVLGVVASGQGGIAPATQIVDDGVVAGLTLSPDTDWHVDGVTGCGGSLAGNTYTTAPVTADCTVSVNFAIDAHTVTASVVGGNGSVTPGSQLVDHGDTATVTVTPDVRHHVDTISGCGGSLAGTTYTTGTVTADCGITVAFVLDSNPRCYVMPSASGANNGGSWADAYTDLSSALAEPTCAEIWVAQGVYIPGAASGNSFVVRAGEAVYGGFAGTETSLSERDPAAHVTILSGDTDGNDSNADGNSIAETSADIVGANSNHVVKLEGTSAVPIGADTVLDGFTVTAGQADGGAFPENAGGGLLCRGSGVGNACSPTLGNLVFSGNQATFGGAIFLDGSDQGASSPTLESVRFAGNSAISGGAMFNHGNQGESSPTVHDASFRDNSAEFGGAMYNNGYEGVSSPVLGHITFQNNSASGSGGGIFNDGSHNGASHPVVYNATFVGNSADWGGGMYNDGRHNGASSPSVLNVTFSANHGARGGAMASDAEDGGSSAPVLSNVIMWGNTVTHSGAALQNDDGAMPTIDHSVVQGSGGSGGGWDSALGVDGGGNIDADPILGALNDYGGFSETMIPGWTGSALDAGSAATCADSATVNNRDQRGVYRPFGSACDIGAVERSVDAIFANGFE